MPECRPESCSGDSLEVQELLLKAHQKLHPPQVSRCGLAPDETNNQRVSGRFSSTNNLSSLPLKLGDGVNDRPSDKIAGEFLAF
jgi:hypothetical protein